MLGSSIAWLSCSCAPFCRCPLEANVRDGVLEKRDFWSAPMELFLCYLPSQMGTVGVESSCTRKAYHQLHAPSSMFGSGLLCCVFITSRPVPFLPRTGETINVVHLWISNVFLILLISEC